MSKANSRAVVWGFICVVSLPGQVVPSVTPRSLELGLFAGESYGLDRFRPMGGGNIGYAVSRALFPFAEASYLPGILRQRSVTTGATTASTQFSVDMFDVHGGLHIRVPRPESRVLPYAVIGAGIVHASDAVDTAYIVSDFGTVQSVTGMIPSSTAFAVNFGGGLRFFFTERVALRVEFKGFKPASSPAGLSNTVFYRFAAGPVFQLR